MSSDARSTASKILRCPAKITLNSSTMIQGQIQNISPQWATILMPRQLTHGQLCIIDFSLPSEHARRQLSVKGRVSHSVCTGISGFRVWIQFLGLDSNTHNALTEYVS